MKSVRTMTAAIALLVGAGAAQAADVYAPGSTKDAPSIFGGYTGNWTGFYVGINGGYGWDSKQNFSEAYNDDGSLIKQWETGVRPKGWFGGLTAGANWQTSGIVLGVETDIDIANIADNSAVVFAGTSIVESGSQTHSTIDWLGTLRGRIGLPVASQFLVYGTGGLAYGGVSTRAVVDAINLSNDETRVGWTAGAGLEWKVSPGWSLRGEYLYVDLGAKGLSSSSPSLVPANKPDNTLDLVRVGLVYKIGADYVHPIN